MSEKGDLEQYNNTDIAISGLITDTVATTTQCFGAYCNSAKNLQLIFNVQISITCMFDPHYRAVVSLGSKYRTIKTELIHFEQP